MEANGNFRPVTAIVIFSFIMMVGFGLSQFIQFAFIAQYIDIRKLMGPGAPPDLFAHIPPHSLLWMLGASSLVMFILAPIVYLRIAKVSFKHVLGSTNVRLTHFILIALLVIGIMPLNSLIYEWNSELPLPQVLVDMEKQMEATTRAITRFEGPLQFILGFVVIAVMAGVGEELTFRGIFQNLFKSSFRNPHLGIWIAALVFSTIHFQFMGFFPRMLLGALFGYLYYWSGSLLLAMYAHFVNNGFTVLMIYLNKVDVVEFNIESQESVPTIYILGSTLLCIGIIVFLGKSFKKEVIEE